MFVDSHCHLYSEYYDNINEIIYLSKIDNICYFINAGCDKTSNLEVITLMNNKDIFGVIGYRRYGSKETRLEKNKYYYDKELDVYVEKETGEILEYKGKIDKLGYMTYTNESKTKIVRRHIKEEWNEIFRENRISEEGKELYHFRKEKVERSFADSKQNHGYRYAMHRGLKKNQNYTWLICAAQNMKNISIKMEKVNGKPLTSTSIFNKFIENIKILLKIILYKKTSRKNLGVCLHSDK